MYVVSFYSYKGGVGRTVALLNSAWHLAKRGSRVALLDLDLEAPGLHKAALWRADPEMRPLEWEPPQLRLGFCDLVQEYWNQKPASPIRLRDTLNRYLSTGLGPDGRMALLAAHGKDDSGYSAFLHRFSWSQFYDQQDRPGKFLTAALVAGFTKLGYDYLFIDARTGLTDVRGATLVDMPDLVVLVTNLSHQSVDGIRDQLTVIRQVNQDIDAKGQSTSRRRDRYEWKIKTLIVASPLPVGELEKRGQRVREIEEEKLCHPIAVQIDYLPFLALDESHQLLGPTIEKPWGKFLSVAMQPYAALANAIVKNNPWELENILAQGTELLNIGRWKEALAHFDDVDDRIDASEDRDKERLKDAALYGKTLARLRAVVQIEEASKGVDDLVRRALTESEVEKERAANLQLALAWTLVVTEKYSKAAALAEQAFGLANAQATRLICGFVAGQAWRWAEEWQKAREWLEQADELYKKTENSWPLLHALLLEELARLYAEVGPIARGREAHGRAQDLVKTGLVMSRYVRARLLLANADLRVVAGNGIGALQDYQTAIDEFQAAVEYPGVLDAMAQSIELSIRFDLDVDHWSRIALELNLRQRQVRIELARVNRELAHGQNKRFLEKRPPMHIASRQTEDEDSFDLEAAWSLSTARACLLDGNVPAAAAALKKTEQSLAMSAADGLLSSYDHEIRLIHALLQLASGVQQQPDFIEPYAHSLQRNGLRTRLLQLRFVQAMFPAGRTEYLGRFVAYRREFDDLDGWLWNLPIAFVQHAGLLREHFVAVRDALGDTWSWPMPELP